MGFLDGWRDSLRSLLGGAEAGVSARRLKELAAEAEKAAPGTRWAVFNRLGDAYLKAGDRIRALRYFGKAIDALLEDDQPEPARAVAKKVIRLHPEAIRTLCTLTWLNMATARTPTAISTLREYVQVAKEGKQEDLACGQILEMARLVRDEEFLSVAAEGLEMMGCAAEAQQVRKWSFEGGSGSAPEDPGKLHVLCLKAAIGSNVTMKSKGTLA